MGLITVTQVKFFNTTAADVYTILMDERRHGSFTGESVKIEPLVGADFTLMGGMVYGKNQQLTKGQKIEWLLALKGPQWPDNHWSEVHITLMDKPNGQCELQLNHLFVPQQVEEQIKKLWEEDYWTQLAYYIDR